ncbi:hypothetical protein [Croceicoccus mobilis]|uniref:Uncharacterized protein n=1 Tax=Croceicoccus mobilis TaxID=1703339 RepID=A0A916Z3D9_9SPHN|nr:hypothetical protein [Croceicoccus mobilis]GGD73817.1 hypothetical protein GCM10010990_24290 [Croceicoccus mobilis]
MTQDWQRTIAVFLLGGLGGGVLWIVGLMVMADGKVTIGDAGNITAGWLSLREIISKMEKIALGVRTPAPPVDPIGDHPLANSPTAKRIER